jgi:hypothetical protein
VVKHVVKPLFLKNLRENILLKKSVFARLFGVFRNLITMGRCLAPKARALPVVTKPLASQGSSIGKSLPRLVARFITRRVRSQTFPTTLHPEVTAKFVVLQHTYIL